MRAVVTVVGKDTVGIIAEVSTLLAKNGINILDITQTVMQDDIFTMIMLVSMNGADVADASKQLGELADRLGLKIHIQNEELFNSMHRI